MAVIPSEYLRGSLPADADLADRIWGHVGLLVEATNDSGQAQHELEGDSMSLAQQSVYSVKRVMSTADWTMSQRQASTINTTFGGSSFSESSIVNAELFFLSAAWTILVGPAVAELTPVAIGELWSLALAPSAIVNANLANGRDSAWLQATNAPVTPVGVTMLTLAWQRGLVGTKLNDGIRKAFKLSHGPDVRGVSFGRGVWLESIGQGLLRGVHHKRWFDDDVFRPDQYRSAYTGIRS